MADLLSRIEHAFLTGDLAQAQHLLVELECRGITPAQATQFRRVRAVIAKCQTRDRMLSSIYFGQSAEQAHG